MSYELTNRTVKLFMDNKHVKSLPKFLEPVIDNLSDEIVSKLNLKKKTLTAEDYQVLNPVVFPVLISQFIENLKKEEKLVYERICDAEILGCRFVKSKNGNRHEVVFSNGLKAKIHADYFKFCPNQLETAHLNY